MLSAVLILALLEISPIAIVVVSASTTQGTASTTAIAVPSTESSSPTCAVTGLCPNQLEKAYNVTALHNAGVNGTGQSIVIVDACGEPNIASDLATFDTEFGLPAANLNIFYPQGKCTTDYGWGLEISLDVEWSHVMAPAATINLVIANEPTTGDLFGAWTYALKHHLGKEISNSWIDYGGGVCPSSVNTILNTATKDDVTVLAAAGDDGAWGYKQNTPDSYPVDCEQVLGIGGTALSITKSGGYISESAWNGGGGGYVTGVAEPTFQSSVAIKDPAKLLGKPDVSADASPSTGVWVYNTNEGYDWVVVGGTSVACPLWASFLADVNQIRSTNGFSSLGFVTSFLYDTVYGFKGTSTLYAADMHDVTTGSNGWPAGKGWDAATGLGSFNVGMLGWTLGDNSTA